MERVLDEISMSKYRKAFLVWLGIMVPLVTTLTIIGNYQYP